MKELNAKIINIDGIGLMIIKFETTLKMDGFNISYINGTVFNISIRPALYRDKHDGYDNETLALRWEAIKFEKDKLFIQFEFKAPHELSPLIE